MLKTINILISGRVQGVMFRQHIKNFSQKNNICGIATNLSDGTVFVEATGNKNDLEKLISIVSSGPTLAQVENISISWLPKIKDFTGFEILRENKNIFSDQLLAFSNFAKKIFSNKNRSLPTQIKYEDLKKENLPRHVAIIPDGNRRWAKNLGRTSLFGHKEGVNRIKELLEFLYNSDLEIITLWCFSTENWSREKQEVEYLMNLFVDFIDDLRPKFIENKMKFKHIGRRDRLSPEILEKILRLEKDTQDFENKTLIIALDYGGRDEINRASKKMLESQAIPPNSDSKSEIKLQDFLDTKDVLDPDLIIRTSGETRTSGFMPYQSVYSELYFVEKYFPDFRVNDLKVALLEYTNRKRRFGK